MELTEIYCGLDGFSTKPWLRDTAANPVQTCDMELG
jgi:hypothetical protein